VPRGRYNANSSSNAIAVFARELQEYAKQALTETLRVRWDLDDDRPGAVAVTTSQGGSEGKESQMDTSA
jgi:hypothetical protein